MGWPFEDSESHPSSLSQLKDVEGQPAIVAQQQLKLDVVQVGNRCFWPFMSPSMPNAWCSWLFFESLEVATSPDHYPLWEARNLPRQAQHCG